MENKERMQIIADNITYYRKLKKITQKELAESIGIKPSTLSDYINLRSAPSFGIIQKLADYFGVKKSDIDSTFKESDKDSPPLPSEKVITLDRDLASVEDGKHGDWISYGEELLKSREITVEESSESYETDNLVNLDDYRERIKKNVPGRLSAGTGSWQEYDLDTTAYFYSDDIPDDDDYDTIALVEGSSMEPKIKNGDYLFIKYNSSPDLNEIVAVRVNGENYVKKYKKDTNGTPYFQSLNPNYKDITITEDDDVRFIGEVVEIYRER